MHATRKVKLKDISPNLTCNLCGGYFIDATTIVECIHSFCRSCIVRHLEKYDYCPVCEVQLHSSKPLSSIRSDAMLQEIVYKLVPGLFQNEMSKRRKFYTEHSDLRPRTQQDGGQVFNESYITSDDMIHLSMEFDTTEVKLRESTKRFILCPAAVSIAILKKLIQYKYDLKCSSCIKIMYRERYLPDDFLLMDIAYKYSWSQNGNGPLQLYYQITGVPSALSPFRCKSLLQPLSENLNFDYRQGTLKRIEAENETKLSVPINKLLEKVSSSSPTVKALTSNGKARGRPKRKLSISTTDESVVESKKPKLAKPKKTSKKSMMIEERNGKVELEVSSTEVQLRISENGVMSAKSVSSGEERILNPLLSPSKVSSPVDFTRIESVVTSSNEPPRNSTPANLTSLVEQDLPMSLTKKSVANGSHVVKKRKIARLGFWDSLSEKIESGKAGFTECPPPAHLPLKVPTPKKWLHHHSDGISNGGPLNLVPKPSPVKDSLGFKARKESSPKKPPKFFKSRVSEECTGNTGHYSISKDDFPSNVNTRVLKTDQTPTASGENGTGKYISPNFEHEHKSSVEANNNGDKRNDSSNSTLPVTVPAHQQQLNHHPYSSYGLHLDDNMNMGTMGLPMHFLPSLTNSYCQFPFLSTHQNPGINPFLAVAMGMDMNSAYFPFSYGNSMSPATSNVFNAVSTESRELGQKGNKPNGSTGNSLDLSMSVKKSKSGYVQISPKKSHNQAKKEKEAKTLTVDNIPSSSTSNRYSPQLKELLPNPPVPRQVTPTKGNTTIVSNPNPVPAEDLIVKDDKQDGREVTRDKVMVELDSIPLKEHSPPGKAVDVSQPAGTETISNSIASSTSDTTFTKVDDDDKSDRETTESYHPVTSGLDSANDEPSQKASPKGVTDKDTESSTMETDARKCPSAVTIPSPCKSTTVLNNNNNVLIANDSNELVVSLASLPANTEILSPSVTVTTTTTSA